MSSNRTKILFADSNNDNRLIVEQSTRSLGFELTISEDGYDILTKLVDNKPNLIFIGSKIKKLDGYQAAYIIGENLEYNHIPILLVLEEDEAFDQSKAKQVGITGYVTKPLNTDKIKEMINNYIK